MATAIDVARYILKKLGPITTMKLQKLVYYAQAWSLAWDEQPLFDEDFEAWANGPVCPSLFAAHKGKFRISADDLPGEDPDAIFSPQQKETLDSIIEFYGDKPPQWLSDLTHKELPWKKAREGCAPGEPCSRIIPKEDMQQYYGGLMRSG